MQTHTGMFLKKISEKLERLANGDAARRDITFSQGKVLWFLHRREGEGTTTMRDIEKFFDCSHATVSGIVSRLAGKGVCVRRTGQERPPREKRLSHGQGKGLFFADAGEAEGDRG